ncbi:MAG TPA: hypothetical protein VME69_06385 [Methylocella sp.]|nr:hypothetical protein [Methylocella sp.]
MIGRALKRSADSQIKRQISRSYEARWRVNWVDGLKPIAGVAFNPVNETVCLRNGCSCRFGFGGSVRPFRQTVAFNPSRTIGNRFLDPYGLIMQDGHLG